MMAIPIPIHHQKMAYSDGDDIGSSFITVKEAVKRQLAIQKRLEHEREDALIAEAERTRCEDAAMTDAQSAYIAQLEAENAALKAERNRIPDMQCPVCYAEAVYYDGYHCTECDWSQHTSDINALTPEKAIAALRQQLAELEVRLENKTTTGTYTSDFASRLFGDIK